MKRDRTAYNNCMKPYITGKGRSKEERKEGFCVGAKICSGKASGEADARTLCGAAQAEKAEEVRQNACDNIISMEQWIKAPTSEEECRPCMLSPILQWYMEECPPDMVGDLNKAVESGDTALMAWALDVAKAKSEGALLARLKEFDCSLQVTSNMINS